mgnify:CR=1 FL=1
MPDIADSLAIHYHQRTKYAPETLAAKSKQIDWSKQPSPFKSYPLGRVVDLKPYAGEAVAPGSTAPFLTRLSRFLYGCYGITARMATLVGPPVYLRAAPSAGGLYPAELYLLCRGTSALPAGLYNYQPQTHSLVGFWDCDLGEELQRACFSHPALATTPLVLLTTAIFYRSAWRYEDRAYRRIYLDTGHLLGNVELAGAIAGFRPHLLAGFQDDRLNALLYLEPAEEGVTAVIPLRDLATPAPSGPQPAALPSPVVTDYSLVPDGELLGYLHRATAIASDLPLRPPGEVAASQPEDKYNFPFCLKVKVHTSPLDFGPGLHDLEQAILKRRSTRSYTGEELTLGELKALLHFTYQPQDYVDQGLNGTPDYCDRSLLATFLAVSGVEDLEEGCYYYAPQAQELRQIRFKNFRRELHFLCLGQDLGRDAAVLLFHTADLRQAIARYGDRAYRYLHLDAGHLGQRLNLAAMHLGLGVSGIGGFFDDQVNEVLGIPADEAAIYITTIGRPQT